MFFVTTRGSLSFHRSWKEKNGPNQINCSNIINTNLMKQVSSDAQASYNKTMGDSDMKTDFSEIEGARSLGSTGEVLSRKDRLQVHR